jgi:type VI secretion system protein ImpA
MTSFTLDFTALLAPISADQPTGSDLRQEDFSASLYHKIKDARIAARAIERQQIQGADVALKPDWHSVYTFCLQALTTKTKDVEIVAWLIEALLREQGFAGLRDGFRLARELILLYWDNLFPQPDEEEGLLARLAPLVGLNGAETEGTLITPIALAPLTEGRSGGPFALWQYQQALTTLKIVDAEKRAQRQAAAGAITLEMIAAAVAESSADFFVAQLAQLEDCVAEFQALTQLLTEKAGVDAPPSSRILAQLNACIDCLKVIARENMQNNFSAASPAQQENSATEPVGTPIDNLQQTHKTTHFLTREQALHSLLQAADFFRRTEPHSPLPYILERAVRWGKMPLPQLLKEIIKDEQALDHIFNLTGIKTDVFI